MKTKMVFVDRLLRTACQFENNPRLATNKEFRFFLKLKDTQEFIKILVEQEGLKAKNIVTWKWKTTRIHELLAVKYCTWISKKFEVFVYRFFLENYPLVRELWWDMYNDFRMDYLPKIYKWNDWKSIVISSNIRLNKILDKENWRNRESKENYDARVYFYKNLCADIEMGEAPSTRQNINDFINKKIEFYIKKYKILLLQEQTKK